MKKSVLKGAVFGLTFFIALIVISRIMNKGNTDMTAEMKKATYPVVYMEMGGYLYNELHGYAQAMDTAYMRDNITALTENRSTGVVIQKFGQAVTRISYEVRSVDGERLIEDTELTAFEEDSEKITGNIVLKDLIEESEEYSLVILLHMEEGHTIRYYTRVLWSKDYYAAEKISYVIDFNQKTFDKEAASDLTKYLETSSEGDNTTFHKVNIHSSLSQVTWGNLNVKAATRPIAELKEISAQTASFLLHYVVSIAGEKNREYYNVEEFYRIRYTADRVYLLEFEREMTRFFQETENVYANDKIVLGIAGADIPFYESEDGNNFAFIIQNKLCSYNVTDNKLAVLFCFYDKENADQRTVYNHHDMKILDVDEAGNVRFVVYGYMNRGRHEGEVGVQVYFYNSMLNTIEETVYIPYSKSYQILAEEMDKLLYMTRENYLYLTLEDSVYEINLTDKVYNNIIQTTQDGSLQVSDSHKMIAWQKGEDIYASRELVFMNLNTREQMDIKARDGEYIMPLGFMGEDLIYGYAKAEDIVQDRAGRTTFPMYRICISGAGGEILKQYAQDGVYIMGCTVEANQINLSRYRKTDSGEFEEIAAEQIMNNQETAVNKNTVGAVVTEAYEKIVQITVKKEIDVKSIKILTPKEVLYEGGRQLVLDARSTAARYYVYGPGGVEGIYRNPANAINAAYGISGVVLNDSGKYVWARGYKVTRNQITAIKETAVTEEKDSVAICLDTILKYEGVIRNSEYLLAQGETIYSILETNLKESNAEVQILDLKGCNLDSVLYYVSRNIPVFVSLDDGSAVLIVGFNEYNTIIMDPQSGKIEKKGLNDSRQWLEENGNCFITYVK